MFETLLDGDVRLVDLSVGLESDVQSEPWPPHIEYEDHEPGDTVELEVEGLGTLRHRVVARDR